MCSHAQPDSLSLQAEPIWVVIHRNVYNPMRPLTIKTIKVASIDYQDYCICMTLTPAVHISYNILFQQ